MIVCSGLCPVHRYFLHIILASGFSGYPNGAGRLAPPFSKQNNGSLGKQGGKDVRLYIVNIKTVKGNIYAGHDRGLDIGAEITGCV